MPVLTSATIPAESFQASDLQRNYREVLDAARGGGALVRDKDGMNLLMAPAADWVHHVRTWKVFVAFHQLQAVLNIPAAKRSQPLYGDFAWVSVLDESDQHSFVEGLLHHLLNSLGSVGNHELDEYIDSWYATAESWADPETRASLTATYSSADGVELA